MSIFKIVLGLVMVMAFCFGASFMNARFQEEQTRAMYAKRDAEFAARWHRTQEVLQEVVANYEAFRARGGVFVQLAKDEQEKVKAAFDELGQGMEFEWDLRSQMAEIKASIDRGQKKVDELNRKRDEEKRFEEAAHAQTGFLFSEPLYVNPRLVPTPAPVVKPTPTPIPVPAKPETLYTDANS